MHEIQGIISAGATIAI